MRTRTFATLFALATVLGPSACDKKEEKQGDEKAESKRDEKKADAKTDVKTDVKTDAGEPAGDVKAEAPAEPAAAASGTVELTKLGLEAQAPAGARVGDAVLDDAVMIQGDDLTVTVSLASDTRPKTEEDAKKEVEGTYKGVKNLESEKLADGWAMTFDNEGDLGANFFVQVRRDIGGKSYWCETTVASVEEQASALAFCKSLAQ